MGDRGPYTEADHELLIQVLSISGNPVDSQIEYPRRMVSYLAAHEDRELSKNLILKMTQQRKILILLLEKGKKPNQQDYNLEEEKAVLEIFNEHHSV